jgi:hypothetical protein
MSRSGAGGAGQPCRSTLAKTLGEGSSAGSNETSNRVWGRDGCEVSRRTRTRPDRVVGGYGAEGPWCPYAGPFDRAGDEPRPRSSGVVDRRCERSRAPARYPPHRVGQAPRRSGARGSQTCSADGRGRFTRHARCHHGPDGSSGDVRARRREAARTLPRSRRAASASDRTRNRCEGSLIEAAGLGARGSVEDPLSRTVKDLVAGSDLAFEDARAHEL